MAGHARSLLLNGKWQDISARGARNQRQAINKTKRSGTPLPSAAGTPQRNGRAKQCILGDSHALSTYLASGLITSGWSGAMWCSISQHARASRRRGTARRRGCKRNPHTWIPFYHIRIQFAHAPSAPELLWRVLGRATVCCSSSATPTNSSTSRAAMALCPCSFARCFRIASSLATNALNGHVTSNVPSLSHRSTLGPRDRTGSSMPSMGHIPLPHYLDGM